MVVVTIKRPNGKIENVKTNFVGMTDILFEKIKKETKGAGRGDVLSWKHEKTVEISKEKMAEYEKDCAEQKKYRDGMRATKNAMTLNGTTY